MSSRSKSHKRWVGSLAVAFVVALWGCFMAQAQSYKNPYQGYSEEVFMDMEFEPNLATPVVPAKEKKAIVDYMARVAENMSRHKDLTVDLMREGEVMVVTVASDLLFLPNDTLLTPAAPGLLKPVLALMTDPMMYKIVLAMHTDDTGSEYYQELLSTSRLNSVYELVLKAIDEGSISEELIVIPFALGSDEPLVPNDTRRHRAENRRLEAYFIPGPKMIEQAHKNLLK
ncbi:MAG: OmpA family protein [Bacteroidales bacterium]|nr:OmpA family protein [Bacteroidales bacterium]